MKRTCDGCRAFETKNGLGLGYCSLGFKTVSKPNQPKDRIRAEVVPGEECPKPRTFDQYVAARGAMDKRNDS